MAHDAFGLCALRWGGPIGWEEAASDVAMQAGMGPIGGALDEAVFHRVVKTRVRVHFPTRSPNSSVARSSGDQQIVPVECRKAHTPL